jgi:hypothetical protein
MLRSASTINRMLARRLFSKRGLTHIAAVPVPVLTATQSCHVAFRCRAVNGLRGISSSTTITNSHSAYQQGKEVLKKGEDRSSYAGESSDNP